MAQLRADVAMLREQCGAAQQEAEHYRLQAREEVQRATAAAHAERARAQGAREVIRALHIQVSSSTLDRVIVEPLACGVCDVRWREEGRAVWSNLQLLQQNILWSWMPQRSAAPG